MPIRIVLDSNVLYRHWHLDDPSFRVLERHIALGRSELIVPEIVVLETLNNYRKRLARLREPMEELRLLAPWSVEGFSTPNLGETCKTYERSLRARLGVLKAAIPSHADVPHSVLIDRALNVRRPFRDSDKGYRDSLLWEVILRKVAGAEAQTFLVSENHKDFGGDVHAHRLHSDLCSDLSKAGQPDDCVRFYVSLRDLIHEVVAPDFEAGMDEVSKALRSDSYGGFSLTAWLDDSCSDLLAGLSGHTQGITDSIRELESAEITHLELAEPRRVSVDNVVRVDDERVVLYASADMLVSLDGYVFKADYYAVEEDSPLEIMDSDWNDHYMWAQLHVRLPVCFSLTLNVITNEVEEHKIDPLREIYGWCRRCGQPILSDATEACHHCGHPFF